MRIMESSERFLDPMNFRNIRNFNQKYFKRKSESLTKIYNFNENTS